jgi:O-antigen/teichoic acid export membrane protein
LALALLPAYAINGCSQVAEGYLRGRGRPSAGVWARVAGGLAMAVTVFALFSQWREMSVPIGASVGQAVAGLWILWALVVEARQAREAAKDFGLLAVEATP